MVPLEANRPHHELRVEAASALLQVAALCHLRDDIGRAEELADAQEDIVGHFDLVEGYFVTSEVNDAPSDGSEIRHPEIDQVVLEEARAAADMT